MRAADAGCFGACFGGCANALPQSKNNIKSKT
jgi:hypothetical protein